MIKTANYNLNKPNKSSRDWDIPLNANADIIDAELKNNADSHATMNAKIDSQDATLDGKITAVDERVDLVNERIDNVVIVAGDTNPEIVDARHSLISGNTETVLKNRLDIEETMVLEHGNNLGVLNTDRTNLQNSQANTQSELTSHKDSINNPHSVTAVQAGAIPIEQLARLDNVDTLMRVNVLAHEIAIQVLAGAVTKGTIGNMVVEIFKTSGSAKINFGNYDGTNKKVYLL